MPTTAATIAPLSTGSCPDSWACTDGAGIFTGDVEVLKMGGMPPETAKALCEQLGVDHVMGIYTEWWLVSGFKKKTKVKASISIYNAQGEVVVQGTSQGYAPAGVFPAGPAAVKSFDSATAQAFQMFVQEMSK